KMDNIIIYNNKYRNEIGEIIYKSVLMELIGRHSNLILLNKEKGHIIDSLKHVPMSQNRYRTILPGANYKLPPMQDKVNPLKIDGETFIKGIDFNAGKIDAQIVNMLVG